MSDKIARVYQEALGIHTGDVVTTSYGSWPYEVWGIYGPRYYDDSGFAEVVIRSWPVISLSLVHPTQDPDWKTGSPFAYINDIRREGDRWFTDSNDEVFVTRPEPSPALPMDMFRSFPPEPQPYPFQPDVDYSPRPEVHIWRCRGCGADFNARRPARYCPPDCPTCGGIGREIYVMPPRGGITSYMLSLGGYPRSAAQEAGE